jgi:Domain of unknown function (DUF1996)
MKLVAVAAAAAILPILAVSAALAGDRPQAALQGVNFVGNCGFSHRAPDDPIVAPNRPGASHDHTFVGNTTTNAFSTLRTLRRGATTCRREGETAAYWAPTLIVDGKAVEPAGATIYYRRRTAAPVRPFPQGFRMIAGSAAARTPQGLKVTFWNCGALAGIRPSSTVPACPAGRATSLRLHVNFPSCWDGRNLDSADHQSHVAYAMRRMCPATHPVAVPAISLILRYPVSTAGSVELASMTQFSAHADFFNSWNQGVLTRLVNGCLNALRHCGRGS